MGKYRDEIIIRERREKLKEKFNTVYTGMYVNDDKLYFKLYQFDPLGIQMFVPCNFEIMDEVNKKIKFPMDQRPDIILGNNGATITLSLSLLETCVLKEQMEQVRDDLCNVILSVYPNYIFTDKGLVKGNPGVCWWAEFLSPVFGGMIFNILFITSREGKLVLGMFNCPVDIKEEWKKVILEMISTIEEVNEL